MNDNITDEKFWDDFQKIRSSSGYADITGDALKLLFSGYKLAYPQQPDSELVAWRYKLHPEDSKWLYSDDKPEIRGPNVVKEPLCIVSQPSAQVPTYEQLQEEVQRLESKLSEAWSTLNAERAFRADDKPSWLQATAVHYWQGDEDHLESLCTGVPVVIEAQTLRELLQSQPSAQDDYEHLHRTIKLLTRQLIKAEKSLQVPEGWKSQVEHCFNEYADSLANAYQMCSNIANGIGSASEYLKQLRTELDRCNTISNDLLAAPSIAQQAAQMPDPTIGEVWRCKLPGAKILATLFIANLTRETVEFEDRRGASWRGAGCYERHEVKFIERVEPSPSIAEKENTDE